MYKESALLGLYCESSVHAGSGSDLGVVDLPIQREKSTQFPIFQSSTLKGAIRASFDRDEALVKALKNGVFESFNFGEDGKEELEKAMNLVFGDEGNQAASALAFTDARLLLFPVKSPRNVLCWITCPAVLTRLKRDLDMADIDHDWEVPKLDKEAAVTPEMNKDNREKGKVVLEEYTYDIEVREDLNKLIDWIKKSLLNLNETDDYWLEKLEKNLVVLKDNEFKDFATMSTEVQPRTKIVNETKVVEQGALWYEENLPAESLLYSVVMSSNALRKDENIPNPELKDAESILEFFAEGLQSRIQLGGNETIGKGIIKTNLHYQ